MDYIIRMSPKALEDIESICDYVAKDGDDIAKNQAIIIMDAIERLRDFPNIGKSLQNFIEQPTEYKYIVINKVYLAFYLLEDNAVQIVRVFRKEQDYLLHLELK